MPTRKHREEEDIRAGRFESQISYTELERFNKDALGGKGNKMYMCSECHQLFEERSVTCPRCDKRGVMGQIVSRARNKYGC